MEGEGQKYDFRRRKGFSKSSAPPNHAMRLLEKRDTLDSISVCSTMSNCSSGYLSDTSVSFDEGDDWESEMQSKVARAVRDLEIKSWRRRMANKKRMERRTSLRKPSIPTIVISEDRENEERTSVAEPIDQFEDPGESNPTDWIEWGELLKNGRGDRASSPALAITSTTDLDKSPRDNNISETDPKIDCENDTHGFCKPTVLVSNSCDCKEQSTEKLSLFKDVHSDKVNQFKWNPNVVLVSADESGGTSEDNHEVLYKNETAILSTEAKQISNDFDSLFDELGNFSECEKDCHYGKIQRSSTPVSESVRISSDDEQSAVPDTAAAFSDLLLIDQKFYRDRPSSRAARGSRLEELPTGGAVQGSVERIERSLAQPTSGIHKWRGEGYQTAEVKLTSDKGHLIWRNPRGTLGLVIGEGNRDTDFRCFIDPQNSGMKISFFTKDGQMETVLGGVESPKSSVSERRVSSQVGLRENYFRFESWGGYVRLLLDPLLDSKWDFFKLNYVLL